MTPPEKTCGYQRPKARANVNLARCLSPVDRQQPQPPSPRCIVSTNNDLDDLGLPALVQGSVLDIYHRGLQHSAVHSYNRDDL